MEGDCASIESVLCFAAAKRTEARTIRHFAENFAGVLKYTVPMDKVCDNLSIGTCDGVNRPAESLTKPATYPARGIWSAISNGQSARLITGDILVRLQGGPPYRNVAQVVEPAKWRHTQVGEEAGQVCPVGRSGLLRCEGSNPSGAPVAIFWYCLLF